MDREHWFVAIAAILYSTITVGGQFLVNLGLSLYEISLYSALFVCVIFLPIILIRPQYFIKKDYFWFFVIYGLINALLMLTQFGGIVFGTPVAIVVLLLYSQPIWTTIFGKLMLKEPITFGKIVAVCIVLFGVVILVKPWNLESVGTVAGFISALLGGLFLSLWIIWGRKSCITKQNSITTIIGWMGFTVIWLLVLWPFVAFFIHEPNVIRLSINFLLQYWFYLFVFALLAHVIPFLFFYKGIQKISASIAGIMMLLEPVTATILAAILFIQPIGPNIFLGGALIIVSNYLVIHEDEKNAETELRRD